MSAGDTTDAPVRRERVVEFTTADGVRCNVINVRGAEGAREGARAARPRRRRARQHLPRSGRDDVVDVLVDAGYDVWLENWRASIDLPPNEWTLDQAAVFDHPAAVQTVVAETVTDALEGRHPLPGLDELHDVRGRRPRAAR